MIATVGKKIGGGFALAIAFLAGIGISAYLALDRQNEASSWQLHTHEVLGLLDEITAGLGVAESGQRGYLLTGEEAFLDNYRTTQQTLTRELEELRNVTSDNPVQIPRNARLAALVDQRWSSMNQVIDLRRTKGLEAAIQLVKGSGKASMDAILAVVADMAKDETFLLVKRAAVVTDNSLATKVILVGGVTCAALVLMLCAFLLSRHIGRPLQSLTRTAARIALGDLGILEVKAGRKDEVGVLAQTFSEMTRTLQGLAQVAEKIAQGDLSLPVVPLSPQDVLGNSFSRMVTNLQSLTKEISGAVALLVSSSSEILASTVQVASNTAQTASAINQTTTTVEEVRHASQLSADKAKAVIDSAQHVVQISQAGLKAVAETGSAMEGIQVQMATVSQTIGVLSDQSLSIAELIALVTDLADQSNLLAVNAAIEAARVGEAGKGFSVVAQEIKTLADQSKQATAQVRTILSEIQRGTGAAVTAADQGRRAVESGVAQAAQAGDAIRLLAQSCEASVQSSLQIAASSQQQVVGMDQIGLAMKSINKAGMETASGMRQSERAAQDLNGLGRELQALVSRFKLSSSRG